MAFKQKMVQRLTGKNAVSASQLARETGLRQQNLSRWLQEEMKVAVVRGSLMENERVLLTYRAGAPMQVGLERKLEVVQGRSKKRIIVNNGLRFELQLKPKETRYLEFVVAGNSKLYPETERKQKNRIQRELRDRIDGDDHRLGKSAILLA